MILDDLLKFFKTQKELAAFCNVSESAVHKWKKRGVVPTDKVMLLSRKTKIRPEKLNPVFARNYSGR